MSDDADVVERLPRGGDGVSHDDVVEELAVAARIRERDARDAGTRYTLEEVAAELGVDLDEL